jgi:hypothetical protein
VRWGRNRDTWRSRRARARAARRAHLAQRALDAAVVLGEAQLVVRLRAGRSRAARGDSLQRQRRSKTARRSAQRRR